MSDLVAGRGFAAHRKLRELRKTPLGGAERTAVDAALRDPRLFIEPVPDRIDWSRVNGMGFGMFGSRAYDAADGSYVTTRCATALWFPIWRMDRWLVRPASDGGLYFLGRVPRDFVGGSGRPLAVVVRGAIGPAVVVAVIYVVAWAVVSRKGGQQTVQLLNGLDVPATVTVDDGPPIDIPPQDRRSLPIDPGNHRFRCSVGGWLVDQSTESVVAWRSLVAYNVLGAAPLYVEKVRYEKREGNRTVDLAASRSPIPELLAGRVFVHELADDVFVAPPESVEVANTGGAERRHVEVASGGWRNAVAALRAAGDVVKAAEIAEAVALAEPDDARAVDECVAISKALRRPDQHRKFLDRLVALRNR
jgi:hypothetical protein